MGLDVMEIIKEISQEKKDKHITPSHALRVDVKNRIMDKLREDLQQLVDEGKIEVGETINDLYFEVKESHE